MRERIFLAILALLVAAPTVPVAQSSAAQPLCFPDVAGISSCIEGRFLEFWSQNGGLPAFGYPLAAAREEQTEGEEYLVQYFERARFEWHPQNAPPYDVLLGRLGADLLASRQPVPPPQPQPQPRPRAGCLWFDETRVNVCDQESAAGFKSYWASRGLLDPGLDAYGRSLALFGLPLTEARMETNAAGATVLTQWFERARFEYVPGNAPEFKVLLGLLGRESLAGRSPQGGAAGETGIEGHVFLIICRGPISGENCAEAPYQATIEVLSGSRAPVALARSDDLGYFKIELPPGTYILAPRRQTKTGPPAEQTVAVTAGRLTQVVVKYDAGMQ